MNDFIVKHKGYVVDLRNTITIGGYLLTNDKKTIDCLLDWRLRLDFLKKTGLYDTKILEMEILATDWMLSKHND